jgi:hypothetical protein
MIENFPFMLSVSKHSELLSATCYIGLSFLKSAIRFCLSRSDFCMDREDKPRHIRALREKRPGRNSEVASTWSLFVPSAKRTLNPPGL